MTDDEPWFLDQGLGGEAEQAEADLFWSHPVNRELAPSTPVESWPGDRSSARIPSIYSVSVQTTKVPVHALVQLRRARDHADRHFAEPLTLEHLASVAALSKFHFHRLFTATYGRTPAAHISERRIERAQDLLRSTNLTVTEVCFSVGFSSLGSFSSRFTEIVGETPSAFQQRYGGNAPRIPGCYLFMSGYLERKIATEEKPPFGRQS